MQRIIELSVTRILLLALAYYVLARLGLLLAIPPGYATAIWPPSGLAIAAVLLWGYPMAAGVFLGSLAVNAGVANSGSALELSALAMPALIASGSTLQAVLGKRLIERFCSPPWTFLHLSQILKLVCLGGAVASIVSASVGASSLLYFGVLQPEAFGDSWITWWLGDSLGVLVFTPLLLISQQDKAVVSLRRKLTIALPMLVIFLCLVGLYTTNKSDLQNRLQNQLKSDANITDVFLQQVVGDITGILYGAAGFFRASHYVNREEFAEYYESVHHGDTGVQALSWSPRVARVDIPKLIARAKADGYPDLIVRELSSDGLVPVSPRPHYQIVYHLAPLEPNQRAQGLDLLSEPVRRDAIERALAKGKMSVAGPVQLVQNDGFVQGYLLNLPVSPSKTGDVVTAVVWLENLFAPLNQLHAEKITQFRVFETGTNQVLYQSTRLSPTSSSYMHAQQFTFVDREWSVQAWLPDATVTQAMNDKLWPILFGGFCIIGSLALLIINSTGAQALSNALIEEKTAELEQERGFLEALIDHLPLALYVKDASTRRYIRANQVAYDALGDNSLELIGRSQEELFAAGSGKSSVEADDEVIFRKKVLKETIQYNHNGQTYWFTNRKIPIEDPASGKVKFILGLAEDITAQRQTERGLEDSRQHISRILENVGEGIYGIDANGRLSFINQATSNILGYEEQDILGQEEHSIFHHHRKDGQSFPLEKCSIHQTLQTGKSYRIDDEVFWKKDGTALPVEYVSTPIIEEQQVIGAVVVFSDISKRQVLDRLQIEQTRRIEQINQELEEFSYVASHDIQEPLRTLNCFCDFLAEDLGDDISESVATDLGYIKEASQRMSTLINDMLEFSRAGRSDIDLKPVSLDDCLAQIHKSLQLLIREHGATLTIGPLPKVMGDANSVLRIFQNLIQNAIKFCKDREPMVSVREVERDETFVTIEVADNGIGIEERFISQIFGAFKRLHNAEDYTGSGIGLAVVKKLVDRHGGKIWVESVQGEGSQFYVSLPLAPNEPD